MRRSIKGLGVVIGWGIVYYTIVVLGIPIITSIFIDTHIQGLPVESVSTFFIMMFAICGPILYLTITPLVMATIEVIDSEH